MHDVLREVIDALAGTGAITGNRQAELHKLLDDAPIPPHTHAPAAPAKPKAAPVSKPSFESGNGTTGA